MIKKLFYSSITPKLKLAKLNAVFLVTVTRNIAYNTGMKRP